MLPASRLIATPTFPAQPVAARGRRHRLKLHSRPHCLVDFIPFILPPTVDSLSNVAALVQRSAHRWRPLRGFLISKRCRGAAIRWSAGFGRIPVRGLSGSELKDALPCQPWSRSRYQHAGEDQRACTGRHHNAEVNNLHSTYELLNTAASINHPSFGSGSLPRLRSRLQHLPNAKLSDCRRKRKAERQRCVRIATTRRAETRGGSSSPASCCASLYLQPSAWKAMMCTTASPSVRGNGIKAIRTLLESAPS